LKNTTKAAVTTFSKEGILKIEFDSAMNTLFNHSLLNSSNIAIYIDSAQNLAWYVIEF